MAQREALQKLRFISLASIADLEDERPNSTHPWAVLCQLAGMLSHVGIRSEPSTAARLFAITSTPTSRLLYGFPLRAGMLKPLNTADAPSQRSEKAWGRFMPGPTPSSSAEQTAMTGGPTWRTTPLRWEVSPSRWKTTYLPSHTLGVVWRDGSSPRLGGGECFLSPAGPQRTTPRSTGCLRPHGRPRACTDSGVCRRQCM